MDLINMSLSAFNKYIFLFRKKKNTRENMKNYRKLLRCILTCFKRVLRIETLCNDMNKIIKASQRFILLSLTHVYIK
jgi:hypothetical protein